MKSSSRDKLDVRVLTIWQSLVVGTYRSFFYRLAALLEQQKAEEDWSFGLVSPRQFFELGGQLKGCEPFALPFAADNPRRQIFVLESRFWHVQVVWFKGLIKAMKAFFGSAPCGQRSRPRRHIVLCLAEPYAVTSLGVWLAARWCLGKDFEFYCFALQNIYKDFSWPLRALQAFLFKRASAILVLGEEHAQVLRRHGYKGRFIPFPLWFDSEHFAKKELAECFKCLPFLQEVYPLAGQKKMVIGFSGALKAEKGVLDLLECFARHLDFWKDRCLLLLAGAGPLAAEVEARCLQLRQGGLQAWLLGPLPTEKMPAFLSALDILLIPSKTATHWKEQFGRIIIEAQACGCLVIGSNSGEIPVVIGDASLVFPEGDVGAMDRVLRSRLDHFLQTKQNLKRKEHGGLRQQVFSRYADVELAQRFYRALQTGNEQISL